MAVGGALGVESAGRRCPSWTVLRRQVRRPVSPGGSATPADRQRPHAAVAGNLRTVLVQRVGDSLGANSVPWANAVGQRWSAGVTGFVVRDEGPRSAGDKGARASHGRGGRRHLPSEAASTSEVRRRVRGKRRRSACVAAFARTPRDARPRRLGGAQAAGGCGPALPVRELTPGLRMAGRTTRTGRGDRCRRARCGTCSAVHFLDFGDMKAVRVLSQNDPVDLRVGKSTTRSPPGRRFVTIPDSMCPVVLVPGVADQPYRGDEVERAGEQARRDVG